MLESDKAVSLEKRTIPFQEDGILKNKPAIHSTWISDRAFPRYTAPPIPQNNTLPIGAQESWLELVELLYNDLSWLLNLPHHNFWSQVILSKTPIIALTSFLQEAPPEYCQLKLPSEIEQALERLHKLVFLVFCRLSTAQESTEYFITPSVLGEILYDNYIFTVPSMLDICALYGVSNRTEVERILHDVTTMQPKYLNDFSMAEPHLVGVLASAENMLGLETKKIEEVEDLLVQVYDSLVTMRIFIEILPKGCEIFATPQFLSSIASFYTSQMPKAVKIRDIKQLVDNLRVECLRIVRTILESVINKAVETKSIEFVENYLTLVSEIMSEDVFVCDYHALHPMDLDFDVLTGICPDMDMMKLDYLLEALASHVDLRLKKREEPRPPESNFVNYPSTSQPQVNAANPVNGVKLMSLITEVQDILPHLGAGFVEACLKYYKYNTEQVIAAVLESKLPPDLEETEWGLDRPPPAEDELDEPALAHRGKKPREHKNLKQMLADNAEIREMKDKFANFGFVEDEYDDEYDDTYESQDVGAKEPDEVDRRRPFVTPRVLQVRRVEEEEEESDEEIEPSGAVRRDIFVQNPEELRAKAEERRAQIRGHRDVVGRAKGQGQDKQVLVNRDKKNVHKASSGNHHRRDRASKKRNQGMIPS